MQQAKALSATMLYTDAQGTHLRCTAFAAAPEVLRRRILRMALRGQNMPMSECTEALIEYLEAFLCEKRSDGQISLPGGLIAIRQYDDVLLGPPSQQETKQEIALTVGLRTPIWQNGVFLTVLQAKDRQYFNNPFNTFCVNCDKIDLDTLCVRTRCQGDALRLNKSGGHRSLKRLFIDRHIPRLTRDSLAVIADKDGVIAVQDIGVNYDRAMGTGPKLLIKIEGAQRDET